VREGLDHSGIFFLAKPFTRSELMDKVDAALRVRSHDRRAADRARTPP
jgi:FixJ family two-component response regulator